MSFRTLIAAAAVAAAFAVAAPSSSLAADPVLFAARVSAAPEDMASTAAFYEAAFGLKEVNRFGGDAPTEIMLNSGDTMEAAKANAAAQVVISARQGEPVEDATAHFIFTVDDPDAALARAVAAGGTVEQPVTAIANGTASVSVLVDPSGNRIELLHFAAGGP